MNDCLYASRPGTRDVGVTGALSPPAPRPEPHPGPDRAGPRPTGAAV